MKRLQEKIKDLVEPQAFDEVANVAADPPRAVSAYRYTDATSDLLARWLDALADLSRGRGAGRALAGARGVGKSHTLTVFGALAAFPELRTKITDAHVATSARRLMSRRYIVIRIERGTYQTLAEEIAAAFKGALGGDETQWRGDPATMLSAAASLNSYDATLVLIIDTAFGRATRVDRDDGPLLSELAAATQSLNAFIALALDDDITDADGANVALAGTFQIDYLDQEHLYRIADLYLLQKNKQARDTLHDIYLSLRAAVPDFNWSEPRFASLYPVHPLVADVAAAVRLYAPSFAFLPFAAAAAIRAVGRPALSLILLDEVFDRAEQDLRSSEELQEVFAAYDELATNGVAQFPVMERLRAKLILKTLFILSLDGRGATASELCAALLFYDEASPEVATNRVAEVLARFADGAPPDALQVSDDGIETRYRFNISASAGFDAALAEAVERVPARGSAVNDLLRVMARARFEDWPLTGGDGETLHAAVFHVAWRGAQRPGQIIWQPNATPDAPGAAPPALIENSSYMDWQVVLLAPSGDGAKPTEIPQTSAPASHEQDGLSPLRVIWRPAELTMEEATSLRRLIALRADAALDANFGETARAAAISLAAQAERIWTRIYMSDGALIVNGTAHQWTDAASAAPTLATALAQFFAPLLEERYREHPPFTEMLGEGEVARLMDGLFGGANAAEEAVQQLTGLFALPLGLATMRGSVYKLEAGDETLARPWVREVLTLTEAADGEVVPLETVRDALRRAPYGLLREAQHLVLAALVAQRRIELVTTTGDRISRRTLDRSIKWEDVAGVCRSAAILHNAEELTMWARLLTAHPTLPSIVDPAAREVVRAALSEWLDVWRAGHVSENFNSLPDAALTKRAWNVSTSVRKSFGAAADAIEAALADDIPLEEGLQRVADTFADSPENYAHNSEQLTELTEFMISLGSRERARAYLTAADPTDVDEIESARRELLIIAEDPHSLFDIARRERFNLLWQEFRERYAEYYAAVHDRVVGSASDRSALEALLRGEQWREFEALAQLPVVSQQFWEEAEAFLERARQARCDLPVRQMLFERPTCVCSFRLTHAAELLRLPQDLEELIGFGRAAYRRTLMFFSRHLAISLDALARKEKENNAEETASRARALSVAFAQGAAPAHFWHADVRLIEHALQRMAAPAPVRTRLPADSYGLVTRDDLQARLQQWLNDLPVQPALIEVVGEGESDAT